MEWRISSWLKQYIQNWKYSRCLVSNNSLQKREHCVRQQLITISVFSCCDVNFPPFKNPSDLPCVFVSNTCRSPLGWWRPWNLWSYWAAGELWGPRTAGHGPHHLEPDVQGWGISPHKLPVASVQQHLQLRDDMMGHNPVNWNGYQHITYTSQWMLWSTHQSGTWWGDLTSSPVFTFCTDKSNFSTILRIDFTNSS